MHPASRFLASESAHLESESGEHDLHAFRAVRRMDEMLVNNFMVFDELVGDEHFDLWVGDEAWDLDHFLHENPELKRAPFAWLTDFVGWLPMADGGEREAALTADWNAEMVEHVARYPSLRDRSVFVGDPADVVDVPLGPGLPGAREWTERHFAFSGYVMGERPAAVDRPGAAPEAGVRRRRRGLRGQRRRLGGRRAPAAPGRWPPTPRPAPGSRACGWSRWPARGSTPPRWLRRTASRCTGSSPTWTCTTRPATSRSCRAG